MITPVWTVWRKHIKIKRWWMWKCLWQHCAGFPFQSKRYTACAFPSVPCWLKQAALAKYWFVQLAWRDARIEYRSEICNRRKDFCQFRDSSLSLIKTRIKLVGIISWCQYHMEIGIQSPSHTEPWKKNRFLRFIFSCRSSLTSMWKSLSIRYSDFERLSDCIRLLQ